MAVQEDSYATCPVGGRCFYGFSFVVRTACDRHADDTIRIREKGFGMVDTGKLSSRGARDAGISRRSFIRSSVATVAVGGVAMSLLLPNSPASAALRRDEPECAADLLGAA